MGEEEENNNTSTTSVLSRTHSSLELLCNTAAWKNALEKTWTSSSSPTTTTSSTAARGKHPTEVLIMPQASSNNFARSTSTLSLPGGSGGDTSSINHVTTTSSVSSFDDSSSSPLSTRSVVHQLASTDTLGTAYRAAMMGLPLRLLGMPDMNHGITTAAAAASASLSPHLQPMMMSAATIGAHRFSSTSHASSTSVPPPQGLATMPLSLPTLSSSNNKGSKNGGAPAPLPLFHLDPQGSTNSNNVATSTLLSEANLILSANNNMLGGGGSRSPSPPQPMVTAEEQQQPQEEQVVPVVGTKNKKKLVAIMAQENKALKEKMTFKDKEIMKLRKEMAELKNQIQELRQLPTGKISQIPVEDMIEMMQTYGSEVSDSVMPIRSSKNHVMTIQKASIVRQFRRWNPNFLEHFHHVHGKWVPKLDRDGELKRREQARLERRKSSSGSGSSASSVVSAGAASTTKTTTKNNIKFDLNTMGSTTSTKTNTKVSRKKMKKSSP